MTREEMEDIWLNKPYGYYAEYRKSIKGKKSYTVKIQPYYHTCYDKQEVKVLAKNKDDAYRLAQDEVREMLKGQKIDGWRLMGAEAK